MLWDLSLACDKTPWQTYYAWKMTIDYTVMESLVIAMTGFPVMKEN